MTYLTAPGINSNLRKPLTIEYIQKVVANYFNMPTECIFLKTRKREVVQLRYIGMFFSKKLTMLPLSVIGQQIGDKDHATVLHAIKTINNLIETNRKFREQIAEIERRLTA